MQTFISQIQKNEALSAQWSKIVDMLTMKQYLTASQNTKRYEALAIRAKDVCKKASVHAECDKLIEMCKTPIITREQFDKQLDECVKIFFNETN